jgi:predicted dehydrogenase
VDPFAIETRAFIDAVAAGDMAPILCDFADAVKTQRVVDAIRHAFAKSHALLAGASYKCEANIL